MSHEQSIPKGNALVEPVSAPPKGEAFRQIVVGQKVDRLIELGIIEDDETSVQGAMELLLWADTEMRQFEDFSRALGIILPNDIESYMRENQTTPIQRSEKRKTDIESRVRIATDKVLAYFKDEIEQELQNVRTKALQESGGDEAQADWHVQQASHAIDAKIEERHLQGIRDQIIFEVDTELPVMERLPSVEYRFLQLQYMRENQSRLLAQGKEYKLAPVPYRTILNKIIPDFSPMDTVPKEYPNLGGKLAELYIDPKMVETMRGRDGMYPARFPNTYYSKMEEDSERIGDFGLFLYSDEQASELGTDHTYLFDEPGAPGEETLSQNSAGLAVGLVWALAVADKVIKGEKRLFDDIKVVLPCYISNTNGLDSVLVSLYEKDKYNPYDGRPGIAFNGVNGEQAREGGCFALKAIA